MRNQLYGLRQDIPAHRHSLGLIRIGHAQSRRPVYMHDTPFAAEATVFALSIASVAWLRWRR